MGAVYHTPWKRDGDRKLPVIARWTGERLPVCVVASGAVASGGVHHAIAGAGPLEGDVFAARSRKPLPDGVPPGPGSVAVVPISA